MDSDFDIIYREGFMEIELKYLVDSYSKIDKIFSDSYIVSIMDEDSEEEIEMEAVYFDTAERRLSREGIIFRVRREGNKIIATLKWNGVSEEGLHKREEINVPVVDEDKLRNPDIDIFSQSQMHQTLIDLIGEKELVPVMTMEFVRRQVRIDTGVCICELSADTGEISCGGKTAPISEIELELYSGSDADMEKLGEQLCDKYYLKPGVKSKFKQGLDLLK